LETPPQNATPSSRSWASNDDLAEMSAFDVDREKTGRNNLQLIPQGYRLDTTLSNQDRSVFSHDGSGRAVVSFRATNPANKYDLATDLGITVGSESLTDRFREAERVTRKTIAKYGGTDHVEVAGHSLGGTQSLYVNAHTGVRATAFNPGFGPAQVVGERLSHLTGGLFGAYMPKDNATVYQTGKNDLISVMSHWGYAKVDDVSVTAPGAKDPGAIPGALGWMVHKIEKKIQSVAQAHSLDNFRSMGQDGTGPRTSQKLLGNSG
jgi:hypothetical protein